MKILAIVPEVNSGIYHIYVSGKVGEKVKMNDMSYLIIACLRGHMKTLSDVPSVQNPHN